MDLRELQADYLATERAVTDERLQKGALILTVLSEEEGLVFKNGRTEKPKRIVLIGVDRVNEVCYGSVLVNTKMSPKASFSDEYLSAQFLLKQDDYPDFLDYDSYADCGELFSIPISKLKRGTYFGKLNDDDMSGIVDILETTDTLSTKQKKRFGIKRR
ncbi:MAG: hypothetical protein ACI4B3_09055 [Prevotella sp.]